MGMPVAIFQAEAEISSVISESYKALVQSEPGLRRRDIAERLSVSEAELIEHSCGVGRIRLNQAFSDLIYTLPELGYIMSLTRNSGAVHERKGIYDNVSIKGSMGLVISNDRKIDLRIILSQWHCGYAVCELVKGVYRYSLQFFDRYGEAIQKIYLQPESNTQAYFDIIQGFKSEQQNTPIAFACKLPAEPPTPDDQVDVGQLQEDWSALTDVHQFMRLLRKHEVAREQSLRLVGELYAVPFKPESLEKVLVQAATQQTPIMCFVGNDGNIQIHSGVVNNIKRIGLWLNVLDSEFNLHLLTTELVSGWLVRKPTRDGVVTSLEFYDKAGILLVQFFGVRQEGMAENPQWRRLAESALSNGGM
ncbi:hemin-degrading factor [Neptunomonas phycophila]|uniref:hemin-degrading factor n=2 Tax=Neptunomonas phycophila TaxID=1572645 RepID=UPI001BECDC0D|nr:ChuX/HutX family heme-like substrate-binding protein [Neptunomonas phycophila]MBT3146455.1 hemin-degrading factor [Neptunomonas phycophila]